MKKALALIFLSAGCLFVSTESPAQTFRYANDALRFSQYQPGGTARIMSLGGAQVALGGDISSAYSNPAGLGFYNRSEISFTPSFTNSVNDAYFIAPGESVSSNSLYDYRSRLGIGSLGVVLNRSKKSEDRSGWLGGSFAITYQRTNTFYDKFAFEGNNASNSLVDIFPLYELNTYNNLDLQGFYGAALDAELIAIFEDTEVNGEARYYYDTYMPFPDEEFPIFQRDVVQTAGSQGQLNFAYGGNIADMVYIGGGIGITSLSYTYNSRYQEVVPQGLYTTYPEQIDEYPLSRLDLDTERVTSGAGINATLGIIARPIPAISLGLSYQTPTLYQMNEEEAGTFDTQFESGTPRGFGSYYNSFDYNLKTPGRVTAGLAAFIEKWGFLTADVEYVNYGNARLTDSYSSLTSDNNAIRQDLEAVINYRLGAELRYEVLRFRAGYAHQPNPYANRVGFEAISNVYSVGAGLRFRQYYVDLALNQQRNNRLYTPYDLGPDSPRISLDNKVSSAFLTVGLTF
ncbi:OmpP1/FadL family transporter [Cesiribacter andamanensis]|uniref:Outer membrane protein transport protein (OMPP1/FadL/TodX) n=1 Tax=Cesiribacter andamanensis AMV16 TaxID=1279009 RepID=M7N7C8_9BACT|nr:protein transporter [Cesiribacter andamanensis]EMR04518.1 Outer membrane protein transport protein (OMPP1/FadL/TodX) [Cesiribacter andamanensis AMV16]